MKIELISENKLKAQLSYEDMECLSIVINDVSEDAISTIINIASEKLGFFASVNECTVNTYHTDEGCEIYITKMKKGRPREAERSRSAVLSFDSLDLLIKACLFLSGCDIGKSECRYENAGGKTIYYLMIEYKISNELIDGDPYFLIAVSELCQNDPFCKRGAVITYLTEHSEVIIEKNAINGIANLQN